MAEVLSIRIPGDLKKKMREFDVNWKEYLIKAIEEKIRQLEAERVLKEIGEMNRRLEFSDVPSWKLIREDRDAGH